MSWNDLPNTPIGGTTSENQISFLKIGSEATIRILSDPEVYLKHFTFTVTGKHTVIRCPGRESCLICHREGKPKLRAMFIVLDRADNNIKIYDAPQTVAAQIKSLMGIWGPLQNYDLLIKKLGNTRRTDYQVIQMPASPLTQSEIDKIKLFTQNFNLKNLTRPHTPEEITAIVTEQPLPQKQANTDVNNFNVNYQNATVVPSVLNVATQMPKQNFVNPVVQSSGVNVVNPSSTQSVIPPVASMPTLENSSSVGPGSFVPGMAAQAIGPQTGSQSSVVPSTPLGGNSLQQQTQQPLSQQSQQSQPNQQQQTANSNISSVVDSSYFNKFIIK